MHFAKNKKAAPCPDERSGCGERKVYLLDEYTSSLCFFSLQYEQVEQLDAVIAKMQRITPARPAAIPITVEAPFDLPFEACLLP